MATILIVEDDPQVGQTLVERLQGDGHDVELTVDAESALEMLRRGDFDLMLLDIRLPGKSGLEVLDEMRNDPDIAHEKISVTMLTNVDDPTVEKYVSERGCDYLVKADHSLDEIATHVGEKLKSDF